MGIDIDEIMYYERVYMQYMEGYDIVEIADHLMLTVEEVENILKDIL